ncbi:LysR family transcriptional regulator [Arthrobacter halodurans]|uniref:LysR family transcriptional regulator n=1 Tax=Arthrobacter halodurans TaxID=516699 RepID=A0ABV4UL11_9MICC
MDLNLLHVFACIYEEGGLAAAARRLNTSQPSVSHALARLRRELNDDLFLRAGRGIVPTARADALYREVRDPLGSLDAAVSRHRTFDPAAAERTFRLCLSDIGELDFLPGIVAGLRAAAPRASLEILPMDAEQAPALLGRGDADAAIASTLLGPDVDSVVIKRERYVCLRPDSWNGELTRDVFAGAPLAVVSPAVGHEAPLAAMEEAGLVPPSVVTVQTFAALPRLVGHCGMLAIAPETIAQGWATRWPIRLDPLPFPVRELRVRLHWRAGTAADVAWFVALVRERVRDANP